MAAGWSAEKVLVIETPVSNYSPHLHEYSIWDEAHAQKKGTRPNAYVEHPM